MNDLPINMLGINLTYKCNLNCFMCGQRNMEIENISREIDFQKLCDFILESKKRGLKYGVYLWGGEPFLYSKIQELLEFLGKNHIFATINTNGTQLDKYIDVIVETPVYSRLIISIDGLHEVHDKIRGVKGTYLRVADNIKKINSKKKNNPIISTNTVVTSENYNQLYEIISGINDLGVNYMDCQLPIFFTDECGNEYEHIMESELHTNGYHWRGFRGEYSNIDLEELKSQLDRIREKFGKRFRLSPNLDNQNLYNYFHEPDSIYPDKVCSLPFSQIHLEPNGNTVICPDFPDYVFGNIYDNTLSEIWNNEKINLFREKIKNNRLPICSRCCQFYQF